MSDELNNEEVSRLLLQALKCGSDREREEFLRDLETGSPEYAAEVRDLVDWYRSIDAELEVNWQVAPVLDVGSQVGGYELIEELGTGGFGCVWRAKARNEGLRDVAIKLLKDGMDTQAVVRRFAREKDVLARLDHSGIAAIQDAGRTDSGRPFIVMQLVDGRHVTDYVARKGLGHNGSIRLMLAVCRAVEYAHSQGIVHRDLKPSNILVTEQDGLPVPKIIDFGIAALLSSEEHPDATLTVEGRPIGSFGYMSPEQAGFAETARAPHTALRTNEQVDVFSLGRILFELLVGRPAVDLTQTITARRFQELATVFENGSPSPRLAARNAKRSPVSADLDQIVLTATEVDPRRRYGSVAELREDLERYLEGKPILARPPGALERTARFVHRHRPVLFPAALIVAVLAGSLSYVVRAQRRSLVANERLTRTVELQSSLIDDLDVESIGKALRAELFTQLADEAAPGTDRSPLLTQVKERVDFTTLARGVIARHVLDSAELALEDLGADLESRRQIQGAIHRMRSQLGLVASNRKTARDLHELTADSLGEDSLEAISVLIDLAELDGEEGRLGDARARLQEARERCRRLDQGDSDPSIRAEILLAKLAILGDDVAGAATALEAIRARLETLGRERTSLMGSAEMSLGLAQERALKLEAALDSYARAEAVFAAVDDPDALHEQEAQINIARVQATLGRSAEALALLDRIVPEFRSRLGDRHPKTIVVLTALANARFKAGDFEGALEAAELVYDIRCEIGTKTHPESFRALANRVTLMNSLTRFEEVEALCAVELPLMRAILPANHVVVGEMLVQRATALAGLARLEAAWDCLREALDIFEDGLPAGHQRTRVAYAIAWQFNMDRHAMHPDSGYDELAAEYSAKLELSETEASQPGH